MKIKKLFSREKIFDTLKSVTAVRFRVSHSSLLQASLLVLILFLAFTVRMLPIRWGLYLSEFDPYFQYRVTKHAVENGLQNWATGWSKIDPSRDFMSWYPYGRQISTAYPGLPLTAASSYIVAHALGLPLSVFEFCVIFPAIMGTLTCLAIYFLGKDIGGKHVGILSAFFLALNAAHISRTSLGFFDDETVGICGLLLFIFFFLRSIETERPLKNSLAYAVAAGLSLGWIFTSWGASRYVAGLGALFVLILLLLRRYSSRLFFSYSTAFGIALLIAINVPKLEFDFLTRTDILPVAAVFLLLSIYAMASYIKTLRNKAIFVFLFLALGAGLFFLLSSYGYVRSMQGKFISVLNPLERLTNPLRQSVQEHRPAAWGSFYYDVGIGAFFVPVGLFFIIRNPTNRNIFLTIFGLTSIYFAGSMVRLTLILAPAISLLWALALVRLIKPFVTVMREAPIIPRRRTGLEAHVGKEFSGAFLIAMFLLLTLTFVLPTQRVLNHAYSPTTIAAASMPLRPAGTVPDFIETFDWMRSNLTLWEEEYNKRAVVASWWDYGYWITNLGNKTSLADNGTWNSTQIKQIGRMFMSEEAEAAEILKKYEATHVLVFTTFHTDGYELRFGDEGKWRWMARIPGPELLGGLTDDDFGDYTLGIDWIDADDNGQVDEGELKGNSKGNSTVLYKLMTYGKQVTLHGSSNIRLEHFTEAYFSQKHGSPNPASGTSYVPLVCVYEINYES